MLACRRDLFFSSGSQPVVTFSWRCIMTKVAQLGSAIDAECNQFTNGGRAYTLPCTHFGEGISHKILRSMFQNWARRRTIKVFCFAVEESVVPKNADNVVTKAPKLNDALNYW